MNLERLARKISRALGVEVVLGDDNTATVDDSAATGNKYRVPLGPPSRREQNLHRLHELIYHARAKVKYEMQGGLCAICKRQLNGRGETDHIKTRAKGRDDRLENLQVLCAPFSGGCTYHHRKHGLSGQRRTA